jgi:hypothetical protein
MRFLVGLHRHEDEWVVPDVAVEWVGNTATRRFGGSSSNLGLGIVHRD